MTQPAAGSAGAPGTLAGRVALVTGGSGGIGRALVQRLAAAGAPVAVSYSRQSGSAEQAVAAVRAAGGTAVALGADLSRPNTPGELVSATEDALGPVDVLICNAGLGRMQSLGEISTADYDEMMAINLRAPFLLAQRTVPAMADRGFGRVLFMSSIAGLTGGIVGPHYAASKAGLHGLTHYLASNFAAQGVTVNALAPSLITETGMLPGNAAELASWVPAGRLGLPGEVADLAMAVLTNAYLTNQVICLDGGRYPH